MVSIEETNQTTLKTRSPTLTKRSSFQSSFSLWLKTATENISPDTPKSQEWHLIFLFFCFSFFFIFHFLTTTTRVNSFHLLPITIRFSMSSRPLSISFVTLWGQSEDDGDEIEEEEVKWPKNSPTGVTALWRHAPSTIVGIVPRSTVQRSLDHNKVETRAMAKHKTSWENGKKKQELGLSSKF